MHIYQLSTLESFIKYKSQLACLLALFGSIIVSNGQPVANFNAAPLSGCAPVVVQFSDNSTGNPTAWTWDFGNGSVSSQKNPVATYTNPGTYTVKLTVSNASGANTITKPSYITVHAKPVVLFLAADTSDCIPFTTAFTDQSTTATGSITSWHWDFDDGTASTLKNPSHLYNQPGNYNITLQVTNNGGCTSSLSKLAYIKAADSIRPQFIFTPPSKCKPPETIFFTNNTLGPGTLLYTWYFGDGTSSASFSPSHSYTSGGSFSVKLVARNNIGCTDSVTYSNAVAIKDVHSAISSADTVCANYKMPLVNATIPSPLSSKWVFSDGTSSFGNTTAKTWAAAGNYTVKLVSNFNACSDSTTKNIKVIAAPVINFSASDSSACRAPFTVNFSDLTGGATNWLWNFGDGGSSSAKNPSHTFTSDGEFNIKLSASSASGCSSSVTQFRFIRILKPQVTIDTKGGGGCRPYTFRPSASVVAPDGVVSWLWDFGNGNTSPNRFPVEVYPDSGTYDIKLTVATADGCVDSATVQAGVRTGNLPHVDFSLLPTVVCPGADVQFTDLSAPADKWLWRFTNRDSSIFQNPLHKFTDSGKYNIKLIAWNNGCSDSITKTQAITVLPGLGRFRPVYSCINKREVFFKDSSIMPQTWQWDFGDGTTSNIQNPTHIFTGYQPYNVSLTTTNGACTYNTRAIITPIKETPDFVSTKNKMCNPDSVVFYMRNFNKANVVKYIWDFGDGIRDSISGDNARHAYTSRGNYTVSLTAVDTNGCSETTSKAGFIKVYEPHAGFASNTAGGCQNKNFNFTDTSNFATGIFNISQWIWDFGDGQIQTFNAPPPSPITHIYTEKGYYYPSLKIVDSVGCADSVSYSMPVNIYQPLANFFAANFNTCINDTVIIRNPSSGYRLSYWWGFGDGTFSSDSLPEKKYTANGDYTMKLVVTDAAGCKDSMARNNYIKVRDVLADFKVNDSVGTCTPFQVNFTNTSSNALSQLWDFGDGGFSSTSHPSYSYSVPGTYYAKLTAKRSAHCFATDSIKISVNGPTASLQYAPLNGCSPLNVLFKVTSPDSLSYIWDFNDGNTFSSSDSSTIHAYTLPGSFVPSVVLKDTGGCILAITGTDTIKNLSSKVNFGVIDSAICSGDSVYFSDSSFSGSNVSGYRWEFGDGNIASTKNASHFYNSPGTYTVKLFVSTIPGCMDSLAKPKYIKVHTKPQISIAGNNAVYCGASSITFSGNVATTDTSASVWKWDFGNGQISSLQNPLPQQYKDTGSYNIQLAMAYASGCADTANTSIRILPAPNTSAGKDTAICEGGKATLHATGADGYTWQPVDYLSCTNCENPVSNTPGKILYYATGTNINGCSKTDSVLVDVKIPFKITGLVPAASVCKGKALQFAVSGSENYSWSPSAGLSNASISNPIASPSATTTYTVIGFDSINCFRDTASVFVEVLPVPVVNAGRDIILLSGKNITLSPQYSSGITNWLWQPSTGLSCTNCPNPVATPNNGIVYTITATNADGCTASDDIFVQLQCDRSNIYIPTSFTPNNDAKNDVFCPLSPTGAIGFTITAFKIYNRSGELVFESANFTTNDKSKGWNGKYKGRDADTGTYVYTVEFVCGNKQIVSFSGNILLLR